MGFFGGGGAAASNMVGATSSAAGTAGLVPAPAAGQEHLMLKGGASFGWVWPPSTDFANTEYHGIYNTNIGGVSAGSLLSTKLYLSIILISGEKSFNRIGFRFGSAAGCDARIGLYECSTTNFRPSSLIVASGALSGTTNTNVEFTISPSITLKNKIYFASLIPSLSTSMFANGQYQSDIMTYLGGGTASNTNPSNNRMYVDFSYAALPSDLSSYTLKFDAASNAPIVYLRNV